MCVHAWVAPAARVDPRLRRAARLGALLALGLVQGRGVREALLEPRLELPPRDRVVAVGVELGEHLVEGLARGAALLDLLGLTLPQTLRRNLRQTLRRTLPGS